jgi:lysozyme
MGFGGNMNIEQLAAQLEIDEGKKKRIYLDTATPPRWTGGIGRNMTDRDFSEDEIQLMLKNDIDLVCDQLDNRMPWWKHMTERRRQALANFTFNVGINTAMTFKNSMALLQSGQYSKAADAMMDSKWARQVGDRANRVTTMIREG